MVEPMKHQSVGRLKYFVTLLDRYSEYFLVRFVDRKSGRSEAVIEMTLRSENVFNKKICGTILIKRNMVK